MLVKALICLVQGAPEEPGFFARTAELLLPGALPFLWDVLALAARRHRLEQLGGSESAAPHEGLAFCLI